MSRGAPTLDHIQVVVPPELETVAKVFYGSILGLPEIPKPPGPRQREGAWYDAGPVQLHLAIEAFDPAAARLRRPHIGLAVADLAAAEAVLRRHGVAYEPDGNRIFVRDPGGNRLELLASPQTG